MDQWLRAALAEDLGPGDVTTESIVSPDLSASMEFRAGSGLIVCGLFAAERVFSLLDPQARAERMEEGAPAGSDAVIMKGRANARALLSGERVALNIAQHLSGIATLTREYVQAVAGTGAKIAATRKTMPGVRLLQKYAVKTGGGVPHRFGLSDGVLIKDNHKAVAGSVSEAVDRARSGAHHLLKIEVEVTSADEAEEAVAAGADMLLLDNMDPGEMRAVVRELGGKALIEASGGITLENVSEVAACGVDLISVGAITHSAPAAEVSADLHLEDS